MTWLLRQRLLAWWRSSVWTVPLLCMAAAIAVAPLLRDADRRLAGTFFGFTPDGARAVLGAMTASMLTFTVFVYSMMLLAVQIASSQMSPRIIARTFCNQTIKNCLGLFVFTFTYSVAVLGRIEETTPQLPAAVAVVLSLLSIAVFLYLIDFLGKGLRPISVLTEVAAEGADVIASVYPDLIDVAGQVRAKSPPPALSEPAQTISHRGASGIVIALDLKDMLTAARQADAAIEVVPQVGDFIATGDPLFRVFAAASLSEAPLRRFVATGHERTMEQDPAFAFRIIVDIASKALSPAINDPTTAVLALDQLHYLLRMVGLRQLDAGRVHDADGRLRLIYRTPNWEDFVCLAVTEIRQFGVGSIQVARRLRAMLEDLIKFLPPARVPILHEELTLLNRSVERGFSDPADRTLAGTGDYQGMGSSR